MPTRTPSNLEQAELVFLDGVPGLLVPSGEIWLIPHIYSVKTSVFAETCLEIELSIHPPAWHIRTINSTDLGLASNFNATDVPESAE